MKEDEQKRKEKGKNLTREEEEKSEKLR